MFGRLNRGLAMVELLVALLVFSTGVLGLMAAQLGGKRAGYDALQRSVATALAGDILERVRANAGQASLYMANIGDFDGPPPGAPPVDCDTLACTGPQLAAFDLWQWRGLLLGASGTGAGAGVGALRSPRACITATEGMLEVTVTWLAMARTGPRLSPVCGPDDEYRHQLTLTTLLGGV